ncbi:hypothetical protein V6N12_011721 [Hibiscus sabdariffa]|uniref:Uncharacterized protein n=1 Tax=Hibiscus sabdariffa TaxID=183260 RepID=A0ABR2BTC8_9ROSI
MPFTPSHSEEHLPPPSYRGCWHGVSRGFFLDSYHDRTLDERALRASLALLHSGDIAGSGFRPLSKISSESTSCFAIPPFSSEKACGILGMDRATASNVNSNSIALSLACPGCTLPGNPGSRHQPLVYVWSDPLHPLRTFPVNLLLNPLLLLSSNSNK